MPFPIHTPETAPEGSKPALEEIASSYGFLPNLAAGLAESPALLQGFLGLAGAFDADAVSLSPIERQVVLLTTSAFNDCDYCTAAHSMLAVKSGLDEAEAARVVCNESLGDSRLEALRLFAREVVEHRGVVNADTLDRVLKAGFTKAGVLEVLLGVSLKTLTNYANHLIQPEINEQFAAFAPKKAA